MKASIQRQYQLTQSAEYYSEGFSEIMVYCYLLFSEVAPLVVLHVALGAEAFSTAVRASKRSFIFVNPRVDLEVLLLTKRLRASRKWTSKGLSACMHVHMCV